MNLKQFFVTENKAVFKEQWNMSKGHKNQFETLVSE